MKNAVAEKKAMRAEPQMRAPAKGDKFRCLKCGMEIEVTADCKCENGHHSRLECCGQPLAQV